MKKLLLAEQYELLASAVGLFGAGILRDLDADPALRPSFESLGRRAAERLKLPLEDESIAETLQQLFAELLADQAAHPSEALRPELEDLLGFSPDSFAALASRLDERQRLVLLRHAPAHLTESYLSGLSPHGRAERVQALLAEAPAEPSELRALGQAIISSAEAARLEGAEADRIVQLIDAVPAAEQDALLRVLEASRPDFVRRHLGQLPIESALLRVPELALQLAWATVPIEDWVAYLRIAPEAIKTRATAACPTRLREGLLEELKLRVVADPSRGIEARRRIIRAALSGAQLGAQQNGAAKRPVEEKKPGKEAGHEREGQNR
jgi:hypothetical protein